MFELFKSVTFASLLVFLFQLGFTSSSGGGDGSSDWAEYFRSSDYASTGRSRSGTGRSRSDGTNSSVNQPSRGNESATSGSASHEGYDEAFYDPDPISAEKLEEKVGILDENIKNMWTVYVNFKAVLRVLGLTDTSTVEDALSEGYLFELDEDESTYRQEAVGLIMEDTSVEAKQAVSDYNGLVERFRSDVQQKSEEYKSAYMNSTEKSITLWQLFNFSQPQQSTGESSKRRRR